MHGYEATITPALLARLRRQGYTPLAYGPQPRRPDDSRLAWGLIATSRIGVVVWTDGQRYINCPSTWATRPHDPIAEDIPVTPTMAELATRHAESGLTVSAVADRAGISRSKLSEMLSGKRRPYLDEVEAIAQALGYRIAIENDHNQT